MEWKKVKLGEICEFIDGDRGKNYPKNTEFYDKGFCLFLNANNVTKDGFVFRNNQFITEEKDNILRKGKLSYGDIVYTTRGTIGNVAFYNNCINFKHLRINSGMVIIRTNELVSNTFLYYLLKSDFFRNYIKIYVSGTAQPQLPITHFSKVEISLPPLPCQRRISSILSDYDSLIENYQRQISLLEESAKRIYKEWFVDFKFPGVEMAENGLPKGWQKKKLGEICETTSGGTPSRSNDNYYRNGDFLWIKTQELNDGFVFDTEEKITKEAIEKSSAKLLPANSLVLAMYGATIGKLAFVVNDFTCNQACCVFIYNNNQHILNYLWLWLRLNRTFLISQGF